MVRAHTSQQEEEILQECLLIKESPNWTWQYLVKVQKVAPDPAVEFHSPGYPAFFCKSFIPAFHFIYVDMFSATGAGHGVAL
jgi:hypothetical protein